MSQPDRAESRLRQWALNRNGEDVTNKDVVDLVFAFDDDMNDRHDELCDSFDTHCQQSKAEITTLKLEVEDLETWRRDCEDHLVERVAQKICTEHDRIHQEHVESMHFGVAKSAEVAEKTEMEKKIWLLWKVGDRLVYLTVTGIVIIMTLVGNMLYHWIMG